MVRSTTLWSALFMVTGLAAQRTENLTVHFEPASAGISPADEAMLHALCARTGPKDLERITLVGHTDIRGDIDYNAALSERRAKAVRAVLANTCLRDVPVQIAEEGESSPVNSSLNEMDHAENRRVEVRLDFGAEATARSTRIQQHPRVKPLLPDADTPPELFTVEPSAPIEFVASDGVRVRIPADAIVDAKGNTVTGPVDISYRSFNDPWAIIASGIPMHVGQQAEEAHMESLGMFEVFASQRGEALSLRDGEVISLTRASTEVRTSAYLDWTLDEASGQWREEAPTTAPTAAVPAIGEASLAWSNACAQYVADVRQLPMMPDSTLYLQRLASSSYCHTEPCGPAVKPYAYVEGRIESPYTDRSIPAIRVEVVKGVYKGHLVTGFRIQLRNEPSHTEWRAFPTDRIWAYDGPLSRRQFAERIARKHFYQDIALEVNDDGLSGTLRLKDRGTWVELPLDLSFHQYNAADAKAFRDEVLAYKARAEAKRTRFDRRVGEKLASAKAEGTRGKDKAWRQARRLMRDDELAMTAAEFDVYAMQSSYALAEQRTMANATAGGQVEQSFAMRGFGIYNCDQILRREAIEPQQVAVLDAAGNYFPWLTAYGVLEGRRTVITYWGDGSGTGTHMRLSKDMSSLLFVGRDGDLLLVEQPGSLLRNGKVTLKGQALPQPQSPEELGALAFGR